MDIDTEKLIAEVLKHPTLWDHTNNNYHNRTLVDKNWKSIASVMRLPKDLVKRKWKGLRDQFRQECKKIPITNAGYADITEEECDCYVSWIHFKSLLFLKDHMKTRKPIDYFTTSTEMTPTIKEEICEVNIHESPFDANSDFEEVSHSDSDVFSFKRIRVRENPNATQDFDNTSLKDEKVDVILTESHDSEDIIAKRRKLIGISDVHDQEDRKLQLLEKKTSAQRQQRDEDESFFDSLLPYMKHMDMRHKMLCRMEIQKAVYKYAFPEDSAAVERQNGTEHHNGDP